MAENDDRPAPETPEAAPAPSPADVEEPPPDEDDEPRWSGEESLGLLPPD